jgi:2'-5' RNA ligase
VRAFIALDLDESFMVDVAAMGDALRGHRRLSGARWVKREAMHVTLRFLGETDASLLPSLSDVISRLGARLPLDVRATTLLAFPEEKRARVLTIALEGIDALGRECEETVVALGYPPEKRAFRAHLTLARFREPADVREVIAPLTISGCAISITLFESVLGKHGPTYTPVTTSRPAGTPSGRA